jgi:hypothetical protein
VWLLLRLATEEEPDDEALAARLRVPDERVRPLLADLRALGLLEPAVPHLTPAGEEAATRLTQVRSDEVRTLLEDWGPEQHPEVLQLVNRFARSLSRTPPLMTPTPA